MVSYLLNIDEPHNNPDIEIINNDWFFICYIYKNFTIYIKIFYLKMGCA